jgi:hypothetical protein
MLSDVLIGGGLDIIETLDFVLRHRFGEITYGRRGVDLGIQMADCLEKLILVERFRFHGNHRIAEDIESRVAASSHQWMLYA